MVLAFLPKASSRLNGLLVPGLHNKIRRVPPVTATASPYAAVFTLNWQTASGTACFFAELAAAAALRVRPSKVAQLYVETFKLLSFAIATIASMLGLAYLMNYAGMT